MDVFNLPNTQNNTQVFYSNGSNNSWQTWVKPRNTRFVHMTLIGGGGGGGGGTVSTSVAVISGGGGGSSSITNGIFPANVLPDILYIQVGQGGVGGNGGIIGSVAGRAGSGGTLSYVSTLPNTNTMTTILVSGNLAAGGGNVSAGGAGGSAGTAFIRTLGSSSGILNYLGCVSVVAGQIGSTGVSSGPANPITISLPVTGGAAGSSTTSVSAGGNINGSEYIPTISGGTFPSGDGGSGVFSQLPSNNSSVLLPIFFTGGAGGAGGDGTPSNRFAGNGGNGSFGSGGGGGGSCVNTSAVGGNGGRGGDGLVIITCF